MPEQRSAGLVTVERHHDGRVKVACTSREGDGYAVLLTDADAAALRDGLTVLLTPESAKPICCRPAPSEVATPGPCTWPETDCWENGPRQSADGGEPS